MSFVKSSKDISILPVKIDGQPQPLDDSRQIPVISSLTGQIVHYAQGVTVELAEEAAEQSFKAFLKWKKSTHTTRRELIYRVADIIESRREQFVEYQLTETSCTRDWAHFNVTLAVQCMHEIASNISSALTGEIPPVETDGAMCLVQKEPVGPVLAIAPWNASMIISTRSLTAPISAGCSVVFKVSELAPRVHHGLVEAFEDAGLPTGLINVLQAAREDSSAVTTALIAHKSIRKVVFTGSADVGKIVGQIASKHLKPVLMELGGKNPAVVLKDADLRRAAQLCADGAFLHHGQICMSTDKIIVVKDVADQFVAELKAYTIANFQNGAGASVSERHAQRAQSMIADAVEGGAEFVIGDNSWRDSTKVSITPTIVQGIKPTDTIYYEESFAPFSGLFVVEDEDAAIKLANDTTYGLNAAVHSRDIFAALRVARQIEAGQVHIGSMTEYDEATTPIGGVKGSGWGRNNGKYALREFVAEKTITIHDPNVLALFGGGHNKVAT